MTVDRVEHHDEQVRPDAADDEKNGQDAETDRQNGRRPAGDVGTEIKIRCVVKDKTVYILGAGCSVNYGYPLAKDFKANLKKYSDTLSQRSNCERLKQCVTNTIDLMEQHQSPTTDRLVLQIVEKSESQRRPLGIIHTNRHKELEELEYRQILEAKIATVALFLEIEGNARKTGLQNYRDFLNIIFEGNRNQSVLKSTASRILSFNYDRLFEISFADYFSLDSSVNCYGQTWLNSGLNLFTQPDNAVLDQFCLLKLHGTIGISVAEQYGQSEYFCPAAVHNTNLLVDDNLFWPANWTPSTLRRENPEPLVVFPFEKDRARSGNTSFIFDNYVRKIWGLQQQQGYAAKLVQEARQIWVIGYSFDPNDRKAMVELLQKSDCEIIVQNRTKEEAEAICDELKLRNYSFASRLKSFGKPF